MAPLYLITKLQNLKAIHNTRKHENLTAFVVSNYKITKSESYSQPTLLRYAKDGVVSNYKITKSESYSQPCAACYSIKRVVSNYKITKSESYSQHVSSTSLEPVCCI